MMSEKILAKQCQTRKILQLFLILRSISETKILIQNALTNDLLYWTY